MAEAPLLSVEDLCVSFSVTGVEHKAVKGVSFTLERGETLALVGESGSGKSVTALSLLQLLPYPPASHPRGAIRFKGENLIGASDRALRRVRGNDIAMIFQEPMMALNPLHRVEKQIGEVLDLHSGLIGEKRRARILELLTLVGIPNPEQRLAAYPHELSGGQRQRVMIAMALANEPDILVADEPTTALDVTVQAQILQLLKDLQDRLGMAVLLITHDLEIVRKVSDRICVMTDGQIVEHGPTATVMDAPQHAYTRKLLGAQPTGTPEPVPDGAPVIASGQDIKVWFPIRKGLLRRVVDHVKAVDGIDLSVRAGETVGVVGESGSGKSTLGMALLRLGPSTGRIQFEGQDIQGLPFKKTRSLRRRMQVVFQDPYGSLSPRMSVSRIIEEGLEVHADTNPAWATPQGRDARVVEALGEVGLDPAIRHRYPHEFSGGQRQRIAIARAIVLEPEFLVLDEPTSALDRSVQTQIVDLLRAIQARRKIAYLFISHDLAVVRAMAHKLIVMKDGVVVEAGPADNVFFNPQQPYTQRLLAAALKIEAI